MKPRLILSSLSSCLYCLSAEIGCMSLVGRAMLVMVREEEESRVTKKEFFY